MLIGDPYKFAIIFDKVAAWNASLSDNNGYFSFCIDGKLFPEIAINAILSVSVNDIRTSLIGIPVNETIYKMDKSTAIKALYQLVYPDFESDDENDYRYLLSTTDFTDNDNFIFAVEGECMVRILAAKLVYDFAESTHIFDDIEITDIAIEKSEIKSIINQIDEVKQFFNNSTNI